MKILVFFLVGSVAGFFSGLLGIGGGVVMVPFLIFVLPKLGFSREIYVHCAFATSLASAFFITFSSMVAHAKLKNVYWGKIPFIGVGAVIGGIGGSTLASHVSGDILRKAFAFILIFAAYRIAFSLNVKRLVIVKSGLVYLFIGFTAGFIASFFGLGGGIVAVPIMVLCGFEMKEAVGTSSAMIPWVTASAALGYVVNGWGNALLPKFSLGYVYVPGVIMLASSGIIFAQLGARLTLKVPQLLLRRVFACLLVIVAIKILTK